MEPFNAEVVSKHRLPDETDTQLSIFSDSRMNMATKVAARGVELEPIDRLEEKVKLLVAMVDRMKADQARAAEENQRLAREIESMRARVNAGETVASELASLRGERDAIRARVTEMLDQLEALNL